jgi:hypothetical protein
MRVVIDLTGDGDGRPTGTVQMEGAAAVERFDDWLDLLRVLEVCTERAGLHNIEKGR